MMLSVILPVYNAESYLEKCIDSILNQTFFDFEVILINDGSKDNSSTICEFYASKDNRIIYINQKNQGVAIARNVGLKMAKGKYIGFVDADDFIDNNMFQNILNPALIYNCDVVIAHYKICNKGKYIIPHTNIPVNTCLNKNEVKDNLLRSYYTGSDPIIPDLWNKIYKYAFIKQHGHKFQIQKGVRASDYWFNFDVFKTAESVFVIEDANYNYNNEISNSIINTFRENQFNGFLEANKKLINENIKFNFQIEYDKFYLPFYNNTNQYILSALSSKGYILGYKFVKQILKNKEFICCFSHIKNKKIHLKIIHVFIKLRMFTFAFFCYSLWHLTIQIRRK
ncbi:glycosyltransferase [Mariniflexile aquimaris]|uniref:Glycosyltransferase n=1 Tax=Mariniflexile aquimaris TaxID=881009 RepID=A0ABW3BTN7_9FLAO